MITTPDAGLSAAWKMAGTELGFDVVTPWETSGVVFAAYLPGFGGPNGMVIAARASQTGAAAEAAFTADLYLSVVSDAYAEYDETRFRAALDDWGWYGPEQERPAWYTGRSWTG